ncbi:hypothetical protein RYX36_003418 [Vicia faba]
MELLKLLLILITILSNVLTLRSSELLVHEYYKEKCPLAEEIVRHNMEVAIYKDPRLAASLLRLHFHDCFVMRGGLRWEVWLGRKDSLESSFSGANLFIPAPNSSLQTLINNFKQQGLDIEDLVVLSGNFVVLENKFSNSRLKS